MATIAEIVAQVTADCEALPLAELGEIAEWIDDVAAPLLYRLGEQTAGTELTDAVAVLGRGREALDEALQLVSSAVTSLRTYCSQQLAEASSAKRPPVGRPGRNRVESRDEQVARVRRELPAPVDRSRTAGKWIDHRGAEHELNSGEEDEWFEEAARFARDRRMIPPFGKPMLARHVEIKFAMRMRRYGLTRETIIIDRPPCGQVDPAPLTCHAKLKDFLPPGAELTIVDRGGNVFVYRGEDTR